MSNKENLVNLVKSYEKAKKELTKATEKAVGEYTKIQKESEAKQSRPH